jgi:hypothetical protein
VSWSRTHFGNLSNILPLTRPIISISISGEKIDISVADACTIIPALLATIQSDMFIKAKAGRDEKMATVLKWEDFVPALERDCLVLTPFCDLAEWEDKVKVSHFKEYYEPSLACPV